MSVAESVARYAFRSPEKVALQEIGPRFTLKLRWLKKGIPAVKHFGEDPKPLEFDEDPEPVETAEKEEMEAAPVAEENEEAGGSQPQPSLKVVPPKTDDVLWAWKVRCVHCMAVVKQVPDIFL